MQGTTVGTSTDSSGRFQLTISSDYVIFSRIGYESVKFPTANVPEEFELYLKEQSTDLAEIVLTPGENPAWTIIKKLQENEPYNNPLKFDAFSADFYSKSKVLQTDSKGKKIINFFFLENIGKVYLKNGQRKEVINHSLQNLPRLFPLDLIFPNYINPTGFYQPYFRFNPPNLKLSFGDQGPGQPAVSQRNFLNPLKKGTFNSYDFELMDTTAVQGDSVYHIIFLPKMGSTFDALAGEFTISASDYALTSFRARTVDTLLVNQISIDQQYQRVDNRWLPAKFGVLINYPLNTKKDTLLLQIDLESTFINPVLSIDKSVNFDGASKIVLPKADSISRIEFEKLRPITLEPNEQKIYNETDSLLARRPILKRGFEKTSGVSKLLYQKGLIAGPFILSVEPSYTNEYEKIRAGLAIQNDLTKEPRFDTRAYGVYGLADKQWKYGAEASVLITKDRYNKIGIYHQKDLLLPGSVAYLDANFLMEDFPILFFNKEGYRVDVFEKTGVDLYLRPIPFSWFRIYGENENRNPINYEVEGEGPNKRRNYGVQFRYANKEVFNRVGLLEYTNSINYPIIAFNFMKSIDRNSEGEFWSIDTEIKQQIRWKKLGYDFFTISAGYVNGDVPFSYLYNTLVGERSSILGPSTGFQAGDLSNYAANIYFSVDYTHYFGRNLIKSKLKYTQPEPYIRHRYAWGKILNINNYAEILDFSGGLKEFGIGVDALVRFKLGGLPISLGFYSSYNYSQQFFGNNRFRIVPSIRFETF